MKMKSRNGPQGGGFLEWGIGVQKAMSFKQPESEDVASVRHR